MPKLNDFNELIALIDDSGSEVKKVKSMAGIGVGKMNRPIQDFRKNTKSKSDSVELNSSQIAYLLDKLNNREKILLDKVSKALKKNHNINVVKEDKLANKKTLNTRRTTLEFK